MSIIKPYFALAAASKAMFKFTIALLKYFAFFILGIFLAFPISAMCGAIALLLSFLPIIWQILWRTGLGLLLLTAIALFLESLKNQAKNTL
jgi:hypothetical protein